MTTDGDEAAPAAAQPTRPVDPSRPEQLPCAAASGTVLCAFDGTPEELPRLLAAAKSAMAGGRRLVVAHIEKRGTGFWAAAFTGYGACTGPPERLACSTSEVAFAAAVVALIDAPAGWDFAACRSGRYRGLRRLADEHDAAIIVVEPRSRLASRLARDGRLTVLALA